MHGITESTISLPGYAKALDRCTAHHSRCGVLIQVTQRPQSIHGAPWAAPRQHQPAHSTHTSSGAHLHISPSPKIADPISPLLAANGVAVHAHDTSVAVAGLPAALVHAACPSSPVRCCSCVRLLFDSSATCSTALYSCCARRNGGVKARGNLLSQSRR